MNKYIFLLLALSLSPIAISHGGDNPVSELSKNKRKLVSIQKSFRSLSDNKEKYESLERQAKFLQSNVLIMRRLMASDHPRTDKEMSKHKLDYLEEFDKSLQTFKETLSQMKQIVE